MKLVSLMVVLSSFLCGMSCGGAGSTEHAGGEEEGNRPETCPARAEAPRPLPGVTEAQRTLGYWLERAQAQGDLDEILLTPEHVRNHNRALEQPVDGRPLGQTDLLAPIDEALLRDEVTERLGYMREKITSGSYLNADGERLDNAETARFATAELGPLQPQIRRTTGLVRVRCGPRIEGLYTETLDLAFDRNNCSTAHEGEPVQLLRPWGDMWLARTRYTLGWVAADAPLSEPLSAPQADRLVRGVAPRPVTRREVLTKAFTLLDTPYGWGGQQGGRDCSRFVLDVFEHFGIGLPRHSARQALAGTFSIEVGDVENLRDKELLIDSAARRGVVLLSFPGHIMLYLGRTEDGRSMALHAFAEYLEPCDGVTLEDGSTGEILRTVDRVTVSDLTLGRGSSRTSFIERINRITILGQSPGLELQGAASLRAPAPAEVPSEDALCEDSQATAIFRSPNVPHPGQPLRVIVTADAHPGPVELVLLDPQGQRITPEVHTLGGPPYTYWVEVDTPSAGQWTAVLGDGARIEACERFTVARNTPSRVAGPYAWEPRWRWENDTENLYAAFVEQLFDYPIDEDMTWNNLQSLLLERDKNLLFNHLSQDEDEALRMEPDCADLPYFLRAYFSWKTRLPFGFRRCSRGRAGRPPTCGELNTNLVDRDGIDEGRAFGSFARTVRDGVHSANPRTAPNDDRTDVYPVPMTRAALRPGTVFADPYGHLLVIADWIPQTATSYGILVGADAQPDGTIGRRRFWRGSFLFTTDTTDVGAGFQAWRPLVFERRGPTIRSVDNDDLRRSTTYVPWSDQQYQGSDDDFYDRMGALINPRPLDPSAMQKALVDALEESVTRRVNSVDNGIAFNQARNWATIEMPTGYAIFETSGAWEDYSTPARDLRLLISIDAVTQFADGVERLPERFGLSPTEAAETATRLRAELASSLAARSFSYTRSDGSQQALTLLDIIERAEAFEMSYNPNDCVEVRWAAPEGSAERETCRRRAPSAHQARMAQYREWFQNRRRPPR